MEAMIKVSAGELVDKITILDIKKSKIKDPKKLIKVKEELEMLRETLNSLLGDNLQKRQKLNPLKSRLKSINVKLWNIENEIRLLEAKKDFGQAFVKLSRSVYLTNDKRSETKAEINKVLGSTLLEVKQYTEY